LRQKHFKKPQKALKFEVRYILTRHILKVLLIEAFPQKVSIKSNFLNLAIKIPQKTSKLKQKLKKKPEKLKLRLIFSQNDLESLKFEV
jgi:hypothetical protein